jgi:hypothetical protein
MTTSAVLHHHVHVRSVVWPTRAAIGTLAFVLVAGLPLLRQQGFHSWDTLWAEDGPQYLQPVVEGEGASTLFRGYAGYTVLVPRLLALPARAIPVDDLALYANIAAAITCALIAAFVFFAMAPIVRSPWLRGSVAAATVLAPCLIFENTGTITNVPWILGFAAFWAIVPETDNTPMIAARALIVFFAITSSPLPALFLPLSIVLTFRRLRPADTVVFATFVLGSLVQFLGMLTTPQRGAVGQARPSDLLVAYPVRVIGSYLVGDRYLAGAWKELGLFFAMLMAVALVFLFIATGRGGSRRRWPALVAVAYSVVFLAVSILVRKPIGLRLQSGTYIELDQRYLVIPVMLLMSAVAIWIDGAPWQWLKPLFVAHLAVVIACSFALDNRRSDGPAWRAEVEYAQTVCANPLIRATPVLISPRRWSMILPCSRLRPATSPGAAHRSSTRRSRHISHIGGPSGGGAIMPVTRKPWRS